MSNDSKFQVYVDDIIRIRIRILFNGQVYYLHIQEMNLVWLVHRT